MELKDLGVLVTGGASGLGAATAAWLRANGAEVTIADRDLNGAKGIALDVTSEDAVTEAMEALFASSAPRVLVNCAGIAPPAKAVDRDGNAMKLAQFAQTVNVNLIGTFNVASKFAAHLMKLDALGEERGLIINTASVAAFEGQIGQPAYAASKGGVASMTLPLAREFARSAIRVMAIAPGLFLTPMMQGLPEEAQASLGAQVPFPSRLGDPKEFARLVEAIIVNPMLNGEVIRLDGAIRMAAK